MLPTTKAARMLKRQRGNLFVYLLLTVVCVTLYLSLNAPNRYEIKLDAKLKFETSRGQNLPNVVEVESVLAIRPAVTEENKISLAQFSEEDMLDENGNPYRIILWTDGYGEPGFKANSDECFDKISCEITYNKSHPENAHAIVFKFDDVGRYRQPRKRKSFQLYAWWTLESPMHSFTSPKNDNFFNLTFHYRTDADVYAPYGSINLILRELKAAGETNLEALLKKKKRNSTKIAAWAVSNCYDKRLKYGKSLMALGLKVDTFGKCLGSKEIGGGRYSESFYSELSEYKFYLSFENSIDCKDYITEKFWFNGLRSGAVPIVWGPKKDDVLKVAPTKSFVHTDDFKTAQDLVDYLNYLSNNETAYAEYLQWRTWVVHPERIEKRLQMENRDNDLRSFCKLCSILQTDGRQRKRKLPIESRIVRSLHDSWFGPEKQCHV